MSGPRAHDEREHVIIVGVDGSAPAAAAVAWAADDASLTGAELRIVHVLDLQPYAATGVPLAGHEETLKRAAAKVLEQAESAARARRPEVRTDTRLIEGTPAAVLREQAREADELVIGNRGVGGFAGILLGSVALQVAGQANCPVVVVHDEPYEPVGEIGVGVDDSGTCDPALAYAFGQARRRGVPLRLIHAVASGTACDAVIRNRIARWRTEYPEVELVEDVRNAHPVDALTGTACDLIVVGSHGRGPLGSLLLGSVSRGVLHHARCPVAVVRPTEPPPRT